MTPSPEAIVDTWFARQHRNTGTDLATMLDLNLGLHDILLAGHHRDMGTNLTDALDLTTGLAAIVPRPMRNEPPPTQFDNFTELLDWLSAAPTLRLTHRNRLRLLAVDTEMLHLAARAVDNARGRVYDHDVFRRFARARTAAHELTLTLDLVRDRGLIRDCDHAFDLARTLSLDFRVDRNLAPLRAGARALARAFDNVRVLDNAIAGAVARARGRARALGRARTAYPAQDRALELALASCEVVVRLEVADLMRAISGQTAGDTSWLNPATIGAWEAARLHELCTDFTGADLREAQVSGLDLVGVRWSRTTQWPPADVDWIVAASEPVGNGVYVIRAAAANGGVAVAVPDPVSV